MIGLIAATYLEAEELISLLDLRSVQRDPFPVYEGRGMRLIISGIGKANAAMAAAYLILQGRLRCVCNLGAAGATDDCRALGECLHVARVLEPDRIDPATGRSRAHDIETLEGFVTVSLATQDSPVVDIEQRRMLAPVAELVDMEAAAVTQTCHRLRVSCYVFKFVSDTPAHGDIGIIRENIRIHRAGFARFFARQVTPRLV
jgi:nucleoside phosphorylase